MFGPNMCLSNDVKGNTMVIKNQKEYPHPSPFRKAIVSTIPQ